MSKRNFLILLLAAVALSCFSLALSRRDSRDWRANRARRLLPFPWQDTAAVAIIRPDGETRRFTREPGEEWRVELGDGKTDTLSFGAAEDLAALAVLGRRDPLPGRKPPEPDKAVSLVASNRAGQEVRLDFGDVLANVRAVTVDGDRSVVYGVNQDLLAFLDWPDERLRNMNLAGSAGGRAPDRIILSPGDADPALAITLTRMPGGWRQTHPVDWPTDDMRMDLLLRWLDRLHADSIADESPTNLDAYGLDKPSGFIEVRYDSPAADRDRRILFGKDTGTGGIYAMVKSRSPVFVIPKESLAEISMLRTEKHPVVWRNFFRRRTVDLTGNKTPVLFRLERFLPTPETLTIRRSGEGKHEEWHGELATENGTLRFPVDPPQTPSGERADNPLGQLQGALANLRVKSFLRDGADDGNESAGDLNWTEFPAWRLSCRAADGTESPVLTLYAADAQGRLPSGIPYIPGDADPQPAHTAPGYPDRSGFAFSLSDGPALLETFPDMAYKLCLPLYRYHGRRLLDHSIREVARVVVQSGGEETIYFRRARDHNLQWWKNPQNPEPLMDGNNRFTSLVERLAQLRAEGFVSDRNGDVSEFGLDQPEITAIVYSSSDAAEANAPGRRMFTLSLGKKAVQAGNRYARLDGEGSVFLLNEKTAAALRADYE